MPPGRSRLARIAWAGLTIGLLTVGVGWSQRQAVWRLVYPSLPPRIQAAPYRLRARLTPLRPGRQLLPTAAAQPRAATSAPLLSLATASPLVRLSRAPTSTATKPPPNLPATFEITHLRHEYQTWNNCGPATISMALSVFGKSEGQAAAARTLKPDPDDKNVSPEELAAYARSRGLEAMVRVNGTVDRLRALVALGLPVVVETWFIPEPGDEMGHYRVVIGYDHAQEQLLTADSYLGPRVTVPYAEFDRLWRVFNRTYLVVYDVPHAAQVVQLLGTDQNQRAMYLAAVVRAEAELRDQPDAFAWFNMGSSLQGLGEAAGAAAAFDRARGLGLPWRMLWYQFGPFDSYAAVGRWQDVLSLADANLRWAGNLEESWYWRGRALAALGDPVGAQRAYRRALDFHPGFPPAVAALAEMEVR